MKGTPIYARDIDERLRHDGFFGKGFEALLEKAKENNIDVIVGYFEDKPYIEE